METQIWHPYCYKRIFSRGLLLSVVYKLVFLPSSCFPLFQCRAFSTVFPSRTPLKYFHAFTVTCRTVCYFTRALIVSQTPGWFVLYVSLDSLQVCRFCNIQGCFCMRVCLKNVGFVQFFSPQLPLACTRCLIH